MSDHLYTISQAPTLPREILKWLQTLKLSYPVKLPRRDLATGFTVAEICATYWPDIPMHSFANGLSASNKESNWHLLRKIFLANGLVYKNPKSISPFQHTNEAAMAAVRKNMSKEESDFDDLISGVMNAEGNNAFDLLQLLYTVFTGKVVQQTSSDATLPPALVKPPPFVKNSVSGGSASNPTSLSQRNEEAQAAAAAAILASQMDNAQMADNERRRRELLGTDDPADSPTKKAQNAAAAAGPRSVAKLVRRQAEAIKATPTDAEDEGPAVQFSSVTVRPLPAAMMARFSGYNVADSASGASATANQQKNAGGKKGSMMSAEESSRSDTDACVYLSGLVDTILSRDLQIDPFSSAHGASPWVLDAATPTLFEYILRHSTVQVPQSTAGAATTNNTNTSVAIPATTTIVGLVWERLALDHLTAIADFFLAHPQQIGVLVKAMLAVKASQAYAPMRPASAVNAQAGTRPATGASAAHTKAQQAANANSSASSHTNSSAEVPTLQNADVTTGLLEGSPFAATNSLNSLPQSIAERITRTSDLLVLLYGFTSDASWVPDAREASSRGAKGHHNNSPTTKATTFTAEAIAAIRSDLLRLLLHTIPHHTFLAIVVSAILKTSAGKAAALYRSYLLPAVVESLFVGAASASHDNSTNNNKSEGGTSSASGGDLSSGGRRNGNPMFVAPAPQPASPSLSNKSTGRQQHSNDKEKMVDVSMTASAPGCVDPSGLDVYSASVAAGLRCNASYAKLTVVAWITSLFTFGADIVDPAVVLPGVNFPLVATATSASADPNDIAGLIAANNASSPITIDSANELALKRIQAAHRQRVHNDVQGFASREAGSARVLALCSALLASVGLTERGSAPYLTVTTQLVELMLLKAKASEALIPLARAAIKAAATRKAELMSAHSQRALLLQYQQLASNNSNPSSARMMANLNGGGGFTVEAVQNATVRFGGAKPPVGVLKKSDTMAGVTHAGGAAGATMALRHNATISVSPPSIANIGAATNAQQQPAAPPPTAFGLGGLFNIAQSLLYCRPIQTSILAFLLFNVSSVYKGGIVSSIGSSGASSSVVAAMQQLCLLIKLAPLSLISAAALAVPSKLAELLKNIDSSAFIDNNNNSSSASTSEFARVLSIATEIESLAVEYILKPLMANGGGSSLIHPSVPQWLAAIDIFSASLQASAATAAALSQRVLPTLYVAGETELAPARFPPFFTAGTGRDTLMKTFMYLSSPTFLSASSSSAGVTQHQVAPQPAQAYAAFALSRQLPVAALALGFFSSLASTTPSVEDTAFTLFETLEYFDKKQPNLQIFGSAATKNVPTAPVYGSAHTLPTKPFYVAGAHAPSVSGGVSSLSCGGGPALALLTDLLAPIKSAAAQQQQQVSSPNSASLGSIQQQLQQLNSQNSSGNNNGANQQLYLTAGPAEQAAIGLTEPSVMETLAPLLFLCEAVAKKARAVAASTQNTSAAASNNATPGTSVLLSTAINIGANPNIGQSSVNIFSGTSTATPGGGGTNTATSAASVAAINRRGSLSSANRANAIAANASNTSHTNTTTSTLTANPNAPPLPTNFISPQTYIKEMLPTPADAAFVINWAHLLLVAGAGAHQQAASSTHYNNGTISNKMHAGIVAPEDGALTTGTTPIPATSPMAPANTIATAHGLGRLVAMSRPTSVSSGAGSGATTPLAAATAAFLSSFANLADGSDAPALSATSASPMERWWAFMRTIVAPCANFFLQSEAVVASTTKHLQLQQQRDSASALGSDDAAGESTTANKSVLGGDAAKREAHTAEVRAHSALAKAVIVQLYRDHSAQHMMQQLAGANERVIEATSSTTSSNAVQQTGSASTVPAPTLQNASADAELLVKSLRWWTVAVASSNGGK